MKIGVCHVSDRVSYNPGMTEDKASIMAEILPQTIFFVQEEEPTGD